MSDRTRLIIHLGYHKTGSSSLQKWLLDHRDVIAPELHCYNLADGGSNPLKFAVHNWLMGLGGEDEVIAQCRALGAEIWDLPQKTVCISDESLLGMPLGWSRGDFVETGIYPRAREVVAVLARELAVFSPIFVVFERDEEKWLRSTHNQVFKAGNVSEDFAGYLARFSPDVDWLRLRRELEAGIGANGSLVALDFEEEFGRDDVAQMSFFHLLGLSEPVLAACRPNLERINASVPIERPVGAAPRVLVLGGSNSMILNGWVNLLRRDYSALADITNLSIGASTSTMALYRLLAEGGRAPGAPVVWEYGVNEYNHMLHGQTLPSLLYHLEWLLQICIREGRPFVPLLLRNKSQAAMPDDDPYIGAVRDLFVSYGLAPIDANHLRRVLARGEPGLECWYSDPAHYSTETELPRRIAEAVLLALDTAKVPVSPTDREARFTAVDLVLCEPEGRREAFSNSFVTCGYVPFEERPSVPVDGRALAAVIISSSSGPNIEFHDDETSFEVFATQLQEGPGIPARQLRQLVFGAEFGGFSPVNGKLGLRIETRHRRPMVQNMYVQAPPPSQLHSNGLVALLCEKRRQASHDARIAISR